MALTWAFLFLVLWRIHSFAIPHDPAQYIQMSRILAEEGLTSPEAKDVIMFVAPGYTLLLAAVIRVFGLWAPYFLNTLLLAGCFLLMNSLLRSARLASWHRLVILPMTALAIIAGHRQNPYFLMYPFRETLSFVFIVAAFACLFSARRQPGAMKNLAAGILLLAGIGTREPSICALPGAMLCALLPSDDRKGPRWAAFFALMMPFLVAAMAVLLALAVFDAGLNMQLSTWLRVVSNFNADFLLARTTEGLAAHGRFLVDEAGWPGVFLLVIGIYGWRRQGAILSAFLLTGVLFFLFYSHVGEPHRRFFLASFFFLAPLMGAGTCTLIEAVSCRWTAPRIQQVAVGVTILAIALAMLWQLPGLSPWGPQVSSAEIRALNSMVEPLMRRSGVREPVEEYLSAQGLAPACGDLLEDKRFEAELPFLVRFERKGSCEPLFIVEKNNDVLKAALASHTTARFGVQRFVRDEFARGTPVYFIKPLSRACYFRGRMIPNLGPPVEDYLLQYTDLIPVVRDDGSALEFTLGDGEYAFYEVRPWSAREVRDDLPPHENQPAILCVDARATTCVYGSDRGFVRLLLDGILLDDEVQPGMNYYRASGLLNPRTLTLQSDQPLSLNPAVRWLTHGEAICMKFRSLSFPLHWGIFQSGWTHHGGRWSMKGTGDLVLPTFYDRPHWILAEMELVAEGGKGAEDVELVLGLDEMILSRVKLPRSDQSVTISSFLPADGQERETVLRLLTSSDANVQISIESLQIRAFAAGEGLACNVGSEDDDFVLMEGFHQPEPIGGGRDARWTSGMAMFRLPVPEIRAGLWQVEVLYSEAIRPPSAGPAGIEWAFNGKTIMPEAVRTMSDGWTSALFHLELSGQQEIPDHLALRCRSFVPAELLSSGDRRSLGVMVDRIAWIPSSSIAAP